MKLPSFFVGHPGERIEDRPWLHADNSALYGHILRVLEDRGFPYVLGKVKHAPRRFDVVLGHHTRVSRRGVWNLKKGYLPGYMYWDRSGYSGWAEMADSPELFARSQETEDSGAREFFDSFATQYIAQDRSKFPQGQTGMTRIDPDTSPFDVQEPYVFVACQRPRDTVSRLARIRTEPLAEKVVRAFRGSEFRVVVKCHPQEKKNRLLHLGKEPHVVMSQHSIHRILPRATAVITVNSGVGFEALLHGRPVYTSGHSDYHWVTRSLATDRDVERLPSDVHRPWDLGPVVRFIAFMLREYFVDAHDGLAVEERIDRCVREWETGARASLQ